MQFAYTEEQQLIRDSAREFCDAHATSESIREAFRTELGYDATLWRQIGIELGWTAITIPERYGGAGLNMVELAILQHEQGRRLLPSPFFPTVCLAVPLILRAASEAQKDDWLGRIARGEMRVAVALASTSGQAGAADSVVELNADLIMQGESRCVLWGHACDALLVVARSGANGTRLALIDPQRSGVTVRKLVTMDLTRPMAHVRFENVRVEPAELLGANDAVDMQALEQSLDLARIGLAAEAVGGAERILEFTSTYAKERVQFGRPIGSFQAVKHRLADMMVQLEAARSAALYASCVADERPEELAEAAAIAKSACCDAFYDCAAAAIQLHGGIGFTWEHDAHLYFKRARANTTLLGSPTWQRERLAKMIGLGASAYQPCF